ncbi:MAG: XdhC family protein [Spirochaetales bacterium]
MNSYYTKFYNALLEGNLQRRTDFKTGNEAVYRNGELICSDFGKAVENPDLIEDIQVEPHLVLFGCGHVGKALYDIAVLQDMKVTVLDCRAELLTEEAFPKATRICGSYEELLSREYDDFLSPYYCIFTHGHIHDEVCLKYALRHRHTYVGMIGSKAKVAHCLESVRSDGITDSMLEKLHSPIGLSINAVTPQEIAVSIMAQIISVFRANKKIITADASVLGIAREKTGIMARIVEKSGSAPRAVGSMLFITEDKAYGTIGGGAIEEHAINKAREMLKTGESFLLERHSLTENEPLGMTCGGNNSVLYKLVKQG